MLDDLFLKVVALCWVTGILGFVLGAIWYSATRSGPRQ